MEKEDNWVWKDEEFLIYMVKYAYNCLRRGQEGDNFSDYKKFWRCKVLSSAHVTTWRVLENKIATS